MMFLVLFVGQTMFPNSAISQSLNDNEKILRNIENARIQIPRANVGTIGQILGGVQMDYNWYNKILRPTFQGDIVILETSNPELLKNKYEEWSNKKTIETLHSLIRFLDILKKYNKYFNEAKTFENNIDSIIKDTEKMEHRAVGSNDLNQMLLVYYRLRFIEPYKDAKVRMEAMVPIIKERQAALIQEKEIASIKKELENSINKGETRIELEQRISKLPENERISIEELRKKLLEEKSLQAAKAQEKKEKIEKTARRQEEIDQAIKWRKEELETGKPNPKAQEQIQKDQEIKRAVELWEMEYKKQMAEKKVDEAKRLLAEKERAKIEEQRKKEVEVTERKKREETEKIEEQRKKEIEVAEKKKREETEKRKGILARYNVKAEVSAADLRKNPFQFEGKVILLTGISFDRMLEKGLAVFNYSTSSIGWAGSISHGSPVVSSSTEELLVSKVPVDFSKRYVDLIVKGKGTTKATNMLGAVITLPLVEYIDVCEK
jgi:hypothetical protein